MEYDLKKIYMFAHMSDAEIGQVMQTAHHITLSDGQILFQAGDAANRFFLVIQGQIKLFRLAPNGNEKVIEIILPNHTFAEALMFDESHSYPVSASAMGEVKLVAIDSDSFLEFLRGSIDTCFKVMAHMSKRLKKLIKEIDDLTLQSAAGRVAGFIWGHWDDVKEQGNQFKLAAPKGVIASRLSVTPETFSRILHNFSEIELISVDGYWIEVLDTQGLYAFAESAGICGKIISSGAGKTNSR